MNGREMYLNVALEHGYKKNPGLGIWHCGLSFFPAVIYNRLDLLD